MKPSSNKLQYSGLTDRGRVREQNEDNWFADPEEGVFVVSDGMGGQLAGALASKVVVEVLPQMLRQRMQEWSEWPSAEALEKLRLILSDLSEQLRQRTEGQPGMEGMGATVVVVLVKGPKALLGHMGDSRAYLFRRDRLKGLTKDHTVVRLLVESGDITEEEAATHPASSQLTRFVGMKGEPLPEVQLVKLSAGDRLLLCTDGLTKMVADRKIQSMLGRNAGLDTASKRLIVATNQGGGRDNVTVLLLELGVARGRENAALVSKNELHRASGPKKSSGGRAELRGNAGSNPQKL
jgi:PPM family protein phosphatase